MRRSHRRNYYERLPSNSSHSDKLIAIENDDLTEQLEDKVNILKSLSIDIDAEVKYQHCLLRNMHYGFETTRRFLSNMLGRVTRISSNSGGHNILYLILFSMAVFLYYIYF